MTKGKEPTPKQAEVLSWLEAGTSVPAIADAMNITENAVYGHMRKMRDRGIAVPVPPSARLDAPTGNGNGVTLHVPSTNGSTLVDPADNLRDWISSIDSQIEADEIEIANHETEIASLRANVSGGQTRRDIYQSALDTLVAD